MARPDRRVRIADAAIELAATGGTHLVTHQGIDRHLDLPKGSTSYYFRTRAALIGAAAERLVTRSRDGFGAALDLPVTSPAEVIVAYVTELVTARRTDVLARQALLLDEGLDAHVRDAVVSCLFSRAAATALMSDQPSPQSSAATLLTVLEGIVFTHTQGAARALAAHAHQRVIADLVTATFPWLAPARRRGQ